jgi:hydroxyacylglutathione hydrolase
MMEKLNLEGPPLLCALAPPRPLSPGEFAARAREAVVLDTRMELGFNAGHVPGALSIWRNGVPGWAGWFLPYDKPVLLVSEADDVSAAARDLLRIGYDRIEGFLAGGMLAWHSAGFRSDSINMVTIQGLCARLDDGQDVWILDVRSEQEVSARPIPGAHHVHLSHVPQHMHEIPRDRPVYIFCASGVRSTVAASLLTQAGWNNITVVLGGLSGWSSTTCPLP